MGGPLGRCRFAAYAHLSDHLLYSRLALSEFKFAVRIDSSFGQYRPVRCGCPHDFDRWTLDPQPLEIL